MNFFSSSKSDKKANNKKPVANTKPTVSSRRRSNSGDRNLSCEELDSDELDGDLNLSDDESGAAARAQIR